MTPQTDAEFLDGIAGRVVETDEFGRNVLSVRADDFYRLVALGRKAVKLAECEKWRQINASADAALARDAETVQVTNLRTQLASRDEELRLLRQLESHIRLLDPARNSLADALAWLQSTLQRLDALRARRKERP